MVINNVSFSDYVTVYEYVDHNLDDQLMSIDDLINEIESVAEQQQPQEPQEQPQESQEGIFYYSFKHLINIINNFIKLLKDKFN